MGRGRRADEIHGHFAKGLVLFAEVFVRVIVYGPARLIAMGDINDRTLKLFNRIIVN